MVSGDLDWGVGAGSRGRRRVHGAVGGLGAGTTAYWLTAEKQPTRAVGSKPKVAP